MNLYDMMFRRRSVRKFLPKSLEQGQLQAIEEYLQQIPQLPGQKAEFRIIDKQEMGGPAPHYIIASCSPGDAAYANVGYCLEQADLFLQSLGLGSLWLGVKLPPHPQGNDCITMAFGYTDVPERQSTDFRRLPLEKIADQDNPITHAARLAPSAVNSQPWFIHCNDTEICINYHGRGLMKASLGKKLNKIDLGIVTRFVALALEHEGKTIRSIIPQTDGKEFCIMVQYE